MEDLPGEKTPLVEDRQVPGKRAWSWSEPDGDHKLSWNARQPTFLDLDTWPGDVAVVPIAEPTIEAARQKALEFHGASSEQRKDMTWQQAEAYSVTLPYAHWHVPSKWSKQGDVFTDPWQALKASLPPLKERIADERRAGSSTAADFLEAHYEDCKHVLDQHQAQPKSGPSRLDAATRLGWIARYDQGPRERPFIEECRDPACKELEQRKRRGMHM